MAAVQWGVVNQYQVSPDKASGIVNAPNDWGFRLAHYRTERAHRRDRLRKGHFITIIMLLC